MATIHSQRKHRITHKLELWFENGPLAEPGFYCGLGSEGSEKKTDEFWADEPFYVGCNDADRPCDRPPIVQDWIAQPE